MSSSARFALRGKRSRIWDSFTITLAIAVVLLGIAILFMPKSESPSRSDHSVEKQVPAYMARQAASGLIGMPLSSPLT